MNKIIMNIKRDKKVSICSAICAVFSIIGLIMYIITSINTAESIDLRIVIASVAGTILAIVAVLFIYMDGAVSIVSAAAITFSMGMFISSQGGNLGYALSGISDIGYGIQTTLIIGTIFYIIAVVSECVAIFGKTNELSSVETVIDREK